MTVSVSSTGGGGTDTTGWDRDILPYAYHIGHRRLDLRQCILSHIQVLSPNVHSNLSTGGGDACDRTGQDRDNFTKVAYTPEFFLASH